MRGRKPKPSALKLLIGNPGKRPINIREPVAPRGIPDCPAELDGEAKAEWDRIIPKLDRMGMLSTLDRASLAAYCLIWADFMDALANIKKFGKVIKAPSGYPVVNPYVSIARQARADLRNYASDFGMNPSSRSRQIASAEKESPRPEIEAYFPSGSPSSESDEKTVN